MSIILIIIILLTYYGTQVGNFVITVDGNKYVGLALSEDENRTTTTSRLIAKSLKDAHDADYSYIPDNIEDGIGSKNAKDNRYLAYSFYLLNAGYLTANYRMNFDIIRIEKRLDSIIRVMIIKDGEKTVYAKAREDEGHYGEPEGVYINEKAYEDKPPEFYTTPFLINSVGTVISNCYYDFPAGTYSKFTIVI